MIKLPEDKKQEAILIAAIVSLARHDSKFNEIVSWLKENRARIVEFMKYAEGQKLYWAQGALQAIDAILDPVKKANEQR